MKLLYVTDIHGVKWKYERIYELTKDNNVDIVINGGDMLPTRPNFFIQDDFIETFLEHHFQLYDEEGIYYLCMPGNDDLIIHDELLDITVSNFDHVHNIAQRIYKINGFEFVGMNWVTDLPFGLKDRARMDSEDFVFPMQIGKPILSTKDGLKRLDDWFTYAKTIPTIKEELNNLPLPDDDNESIYVIHMPPAKVWLDVCSDRSQVGSRAIYNFLKVRQPFLSLHGHIHESAKMSNIWRNKIEDTICIQPGQSERNDDYVIYVLIDLNTMNMKRSKAKK